MYNYINEKKHRIQKPHFPRYTHLPTNTAIIRPSLDGHLEIHWGDHTYQFSSLYLRLEYNGESKLYRGYQQTIHFIQESVLFHETSPEQNAYLWIEGIGDSFYHQGQFFLCGTIVESVSKTSLALKINFRYEKDKQVLGLVATSGEESVKKLWNAECTELLQLGTRESSSLPTTGCYKIPSEHCTTNKSTISEYTKFCHLSLTYQQMKTFSQGDNCYE